MAPVIGITCSFAPVPGQVSHRVGPGEVSFPQTVFPKRFTIPDCGTMKALTPAYLTLVYRSPCLSRFAFLTFRPQPSCRPDHRFRPPPQRDQRFSDFVTFQKTRRTAKPNQVRHPTDRHFVSSCFPPHLTVTQLPSTTGLWLTPGWTCTILTKRLRRRTEILLLAGSLRLISPGRHGRQDSPACFTG